MSQDKPDRKEDIFRINSRINKTDTELQQEKDWIQPTNTLIPLGRIRPSSWDDSDEDFPSKSPRSGSQKNKINLNDIEKSAGSTETQEEEENNMSEDENSIQNETILNSENVCSETNNAEVSLKLVRDRRQTPARIRRRSKSSSPILETKNQVPHKTDKLQTEDNRKVATERSLYESKDLSPRKELDLDSKLFLDNFFTQYRLKTIEMINSNMENPEDIENCEEKSSETERFCQESQIIKEKFKDLSDLDSPDSFLNEEEIPMCRTSRKLSQILEVEETKKDSMTVSKNLKESEEDLKVNKMEEKLFESSAINSKAPQLDVLSPIETTRSEKCHTEKYFEKNNIEDVEALFYKVARAPKNLESQKSYSSEKVRNLETTGEYSKGSLSERSASFLSRKNNENIIPCSVKNIKTQMDPPNNSHQLDVEHTGKDDPNDSPRRNMSHENNRKRWEILKDLKPVDLEENLIIDLTKSCESENQSPTKSNENSYIPGKVRTIENIERDSQFSLESSRFKISKDSSRNLILEDVKTPKVSQQRDETRGKSWHERMSSEGSTSRKSHISSCRSDRSLELDTDRNWNLRIESPSLITEKLVYWEMQRITPDSSTLTSRCSSKVRVPEKDKRKISNEDYSASESYSSRDSSLDDINNLVSQPRSSSQRSHRSSIRSLEPNKDTSSSKNFKGRLRSPDSHFIPSQKVESQISSRSETHETVKLMSDNEYFSSRSGNLKSNRSKTSRPETLEARLPEFVLQKSSNTSLKNSEIYKIIHESSDESDISEKSVEKRYKKSVRSTEHSSTSSRKLNSLRIKDFPQDDTSSSNTSSGRSGISLDIPRNCESEENSLASSRIPDLNVSENFPFTKNTSRESKKEITEHKSNRSSGRREEMSESSEFKKPKAHRSGGSTAQREISERKLEQENVSNDQIKHSIADNDGLIDDIENEVKSNRSFGRSGTITENSKLKKARVPRSGASTGRSEKSELKLQIDNFSKYHNSLSVEDTNLRENKAKEETKRNSNRSSGRNEEISKNPKLKNPVTHRSNRSTGKNETSQGKLELGGNINHQSNLSLEDNNLAEDGVKDEMERKSNSSRKSNESQKFKKSKTYPSNGLASKIANSEEKQQLDHISKNQINLSLEDSLAENAVKEVTEKKSSRSSGRSEKIPRIHRSGGSTARSELSQGKVEVDKISIDPSNLLVEGNLIEDAVEEEKSNKSSGRSEGLVARSKLNDLTEDIGKEEKKSSRSSGKSFGMAEASKLKSHKSHRSESSTESIETSETKLKPGNDSNNNVNVLPYEKDLIEDVVKQEKSRKSSRRSETVTETSKFKNPTIHQAGGSTARSEISEMKLELDDVSLDESNLSVESNLAEDVRKEDKSNITRKSEEITKYSKFKNSITHRSGGLTARSEITEVNLELDDITNDQNNFTVVGAVLIGNEMKEQTERKSNKSFESSERMTENNTFTKTSSYGSGRSTAKSEISEVNLNLNNDQNNFPGVSNHTEDTRKEDAERKSNRSSGRSEGMTQRSNLKNPKTHRTGSSTVRREISEHNLQIDDILKNQINLLREDNNVTENETKEKTEIKSNRRGEKVSECCKLSSRAYQAGGTTTGSEVSVVKLQLEDISNDQNNFSLETTDLIEVDIKDDTGRKSSRSSGKNETFEQSNFISPKTHRPVCSNSGNEISETKLQLNDISKATDFKEDEEKEKTGKKSSIIMGKIEKMSEQPKYKTPRTRRSGRTTAGSETCEEKLQLDNVSNDQIKLSVAGNDGSIDHIENEVKTNRSSKKSGTMTERSKLKNSSTHRSRGSTGRSETSELKMGLDGGSEDQNSCSIEGTDLLEDEVIGEIEANSNRTSGKSEKIPENSKFKVPGTHRSGGSIVRSEIPEVKLELNDVSIDQNNVPINVNLTEDVRREEKSNRSTRNGEMTESSKFETHKTNRSDRTTARNETCEEKLQLDNVSIQTDQNHLSFKGNLIEDTGKGKKSNKNRRSGEVTERSKFKNSRANRSGNSTARSDRSDLKLQIDNVSDDQSNISVEAVYHIDNEVRIEVERKASRSEISENTKFKTPKTRWCGGSTAESEISQRKLELDDVSNSQTNISLVDSDSLIENIAKEENSNRSCRSVKKTERSKIKTSGSHRVGGFTERSEISEVKVRLDDVSNDQRNTSGKKNLIDDISHKDNSNRSSTRREGMNESSEFKKPRTYRSGRTTARSEMSQVNLQVGNVSNDQSHLQLESTDFIEDDVREESDKKSNRNSRRSERLTERPILKKPKTYRSGVSTVRSEMSEVKLELDDVSIDQSNLSVEGNLIENVGKGEKPNTSGRSGEVTERSKFKNAQNYRSGGSIARSEMSEIKLELDNVSSKSNLSVEGNLTEDIVEEKKSNRSSGISGGMSDRSKFKSPRTYLSGGSSPRSDVSVRKLHLDNISIDPSNLSVESNLLEDIVERKKSSKSSRKSEGLVEHSKFKTPRTNRSGTSTASRELSEGKLQLDNISLDPSNLSVEDNPTQNAVEENKSNKSSGKSGRMTENSKFQTSTTYRSGGSTTRREISERKLQLNNVSDENNFSLQNNDFAVDAISISSRKSARKTRDHPNTEPTGNIDQRNSLEQLNKIRILEASQDSKKLELDIKSSSKSRPMNWEDEENMKEDSVNTSRSKTQSPRERLSIINETSCEDIVKHGEETSLKKQSSELTRAEKRLASSAKSKTSSHKTFFADVEGYRYIRLKWNEGTDDLESEEKELLSGRYKSNVNNSQMSKELKSENVRGINEKTSVNTLDEEMWNHLIEKFDGKDEARKSFWLREANFPGFSSPNEENSSDIKETVKEKFSRCSNEEENVDEESTTLSRILVEVDCTDQSQKNRVESCGYPRAHTDVEDQDMLRDSDKEIQTSSSLEDTLTKDFLKDDENSIRQNSQQILYSVEESQNFSRIGDFGDIPLWIGDKINTGDKEKPKDHGDGHQEQNWEVVTSRSPEKMTSDDDSKSPRQIWTEVTGHFAKSKPLRNMWVQEKDDVKLENSFVFNELKQSKSGEFINKKAEDVEELPQHTNNNTEVVVHISCKDNTKGKKDENSMMKSKMKVSSSSESIKWVVEDLQSLKTPVERFSRSLSNLDFNREKFELSGSVCNELFEKNHKKSKTEIESTNLNIFLARKGKEDRSEVIKNNWLIVNMSEERKSKWKKESNKNAKSSSKKNSNAKVKGSITRKNRTSISSQRFSKSSCFQNFYKKVVSVFCLTSAESTIPTSK